MNEIKGFKIAQNKGFHITFKNGWTVSVQFGAGNYCDNYDDSDYSGKESAKSDTAEVWAWKSEKTYPKYPLAYQTPEQVFEFMKKIHGKR